MSLDAADWLTLAAIVSGLLHIRADYAGARTQTYVFKPLTMLLIGAYLFALGSPQDPTYRWLIVAGLAFSLVGDVFLMLPTKPLKPGLFSFLAGHLCYIAAFWHAASPQWFTPQVAMAGLQVAIGLPLLMLLWRRAGALRLPVAIYMLVISTMTWLAFNRAVITMAPEAYFALLGALAFVFSDTVLGINRIVKPFRAAQALILGSYFPAQWLIASSVA